MVAVRDTPGAECHLELVDALETRARTEVVNIQFAVHGIPDRFGVQQVHGRKRARAPQHYGPPVHHVVTVHKIQKPRHYITVVFGQPELNRAVINIRKRIKELLLEADSPAPVLRAFLERVTIPQEIIPAAASPDGHSGLLRLADFVAVGRLEIRPKQLSIVQQRANGPQDVSTTAADRPGYILITYQTHDVDPHS